MSAAIAYRGPDDEGIESVGRATLGVRRLSILDVAAGHQPLADAQGRVWATQNGEIYNFPELRADLASRHPLRTHTDTELLPHLYLEHGTDCVTRLRGMFAVAVYDTRDDSLLLARDPVGVKPLYVASLADRLLYASEVKALLCHSEVAREIDRDALARYLALGYVPGEATMLRAIRKLRPGCRMVVTPEGVRTERYWTWPRFEAPPEAGDPSRWADEVATRLSASAVSMLLSDRPVGILLSGGLDSSLLVAMLPEAIRRETKTFTIGFEGGGHHDERTHARRVAEHLGTRHREFSTPLDVAAELPRVIGYLDEPCADPAAIPAHLVARAASAEVTVLLSGTGGDEIFGGYRRYRLGPMLRRVGWVPRGAAGSIARRMADWDLHRATPSAERMVLLRKLFTARSRPSFFSAYLSTFEPAPAERWSRATALAADPASVPETLWAELTAEMGVAPRGEEAIGMASDHLFYLPDDLLLKEDRTTMGASVEGRVPFLDQALVEFAAGLPAACRFVRTTGKRVLRTIARRHLPESLAERPKHGFSVPIEAWFRGPLADLTGDTFAGAGSGVFRMAELRRWHDEHRRGFDRSGAMWAALCFELWWSTVGRATPAELACAGKPRTGR
jgi:asparagine synthase (glutamine-hydrolysing)